MRKIILVLILMLVTGFVFEATAQTKQKVSVQINKQKAVVKTGLTIKFVSIVEESRCPIDTACIQAGTAKIQIKVSKSKSGSETFELATGENPQSVKFGGYEIKFIDLNPKPATNIRINRNGYTAIFTVMKMKS